MLNADQLLSRALEVHAKRLSMSAFEDWFRDESRDVHIWGDAQLNELVFSVEDVFSQYHFEGLRGDRLFEELENAVRPFAKAPQPIAPWDSGTLPIVISRSNDTSLDSESNQKWLSVGEIRNTSLSFGEELKAVA